LGRDAAYTEIFICGASIYIQWPSVEEYIVAALATKPQRQMKAISANTVARLPDELFVLVHQAPLAPERTGKRCRRKVLRAS
jgi:hypothetical protein